MPLPIAYDIALRWTRIAWVFVVAAAVLAVGVPLLPAPESPAIDLTPPDPAAATGQTPDRPGGGEVQQVAWTELEGLMSTIHSVERSTEVADAGAPDGQAGSGGEAQPGERQPGEVVEQQGLPGWRYVGDVELGGRIVAVVSVSGAQVFLSEGSEVQGFTVAEVTPAYVVAEGRNGRFRIDREQAPSPSAALRNAPRSGMRTPPEAGDAQRARDERMRALEEGRDRR